MSLCRALEEIKWTALVAWVDFVLWAIQLGTDASRQNERRQSVKIWKHLRWSTPGSSNDREHGLTLTLLESVCFSSTRWSSKAAISLQESLLILHLKLYLACMRRALQTGWGLLVFGPVDAIKLMEWTGVCGARYLCQRAFGRDSDRLGVLQNSSNPVKVAGSCSSMISPTATVVCCGNCTVGVTILICAALATWYVCFPLPTVVHCISSIGDVWRLLVLSLTFIKLQISLDLSGRLLS